MRFGSLISGFALMLAACGPSEVDVQSPPPDTPVEEAPAETSRELDYSDQTELMTMAQFQTSGPSEQTIRAVDACVESGGVSKVFSRECIGLIIDTCPEDAITTADMVRCIDFELAYWEHRLAATRDVLIAALQHDDAVMGPEGMIPVNLTDQFLGADAAWQDHRASACQFEALRFRGGSLGRITGASCMNRMTAMRAIDLGVMLETYQTE